MLFWQIVILFGVLVFFSRLHGSGHSDHDDKKKKGPKKH